MLNHLCSDKKSACRSLHSLKSGHAIISIFAILFFTNCSTPTLSAQTATELKDNVTHREFYSPCPGECVDLRDGGNPRSIWYDRDAREISFENSTYSVCLEAGSAMYFEVNAGEQDESDTIIQHIVFANTPDSISMSYAYFVLQRFVHVANLRVSAYTKIDSTNSPSGVPEGCPVEVYASMLVADVLDRESVAIELDYDVVGGLIAQYCPLNKYTTIYYTDHNIFCDGKGTFNHINDQFYNSDELIMWYHLIDLSVLDDELPAFLLARSNDEFIYKRSRQ